MTQTERQQQWRQRAALGLGVVPVTIPVYEVAEALIASGRISVAEALDRRAVSHALGEVIFAWAQHWQE